jgi:hypothetical protein
MSAACKLDGCTVLQTGMCALENDTEQCPNRILDVHVPLPSAGLATTDAVGSDTDHQPDLGGAVLVAPRGNPSFPHSMSLGLADVNEMLGRKYGTIVGILGDPEAGKTACLVSLYLLVSNAKLSGWSFADSESLMAFESISRGARRWQDGQPPDQITQHTELSDDREPGFLHLRLRREDCGSTVDFLLPDLPGEWTKDLIKTADADRFDFMKSADVVWLMTDGRALIKREGRQGAIHRINLLAGRLTKIFGAVAPRLILVPTHLDHGEVPTQVIDQIRSELAKLGLAFEVVPVASFTEDARTMRPGTGLSELIDATARVSPQSVPFRRPAPVSSTTRAFLSYRRNE